MQIVNNTNESFWICNPQFLSIKEFRELYEADNSANKGDSSQLMWAVYLLVHPSSIYANEDIESRRKLISKDFLKAKSFKWAALKNVEEAFEKVCLSTAEKLLKSWEEKMHERDQFIRATKYGPDTAEMLDKMIGNTKKLYEEFNRIKDMIGDEDSKEKAKANKQLSLSDEGKI